jgi:ribosomal protein S18 acetylase RimI-like enzyme
MLTVKELTTTPSLELFSELVELLQDAVTDGASIGWVAVPGTKDARDYWTRTLEAVGRGERRLFVATDEHVCAGAIQLSLPVKANASHRGEVEKLMVHTQYRRRGIGTALMQSLEKVGRDAGLKLLVLDTISDSAAARLYGRLGWQRAGEIPDYARSTAGVLEPTTVFYHRIAS